MLAAEEPFKRWYPASLAKLMTAYLVFEDMKAGRLDPQAAITFSAAAANEPASKMYFAPGTRVTVDTALKMMLVHSANDAARAVAEHAIGGREAFVKRMNETAKALGMTDTHFVNANGMNSMSNPQPGQYTTARDMAVLAIAIEKTFPEYLYYFTIPGIASDSGKYRNTNLLIGNFDGAIGMKTGFVCASGYNQVSFAKRNGREVVAVAFGAMRGAVEILAEVVPFQRDGVDGVEAVMRPTVAGRYWLHATLDGEPIGASPYGVHVEPAPADTRMSELWGDGLVQAVAGMPAYFCVQLRDALKVVARGDRRLAEWLSG